MRTTARRIALALTGAVAAATALAAAATPATAVTGSTDMVTLSSADVVVLPAGTCIAHPVTYQVTPPAGAQRWALDVWVYNEAGALADGMMLNSLTGSAPSGTATVQFCDYSDQPGVYTFVPEFDYRDASGISHTNIPGPGFQVKVIGNPTTKATIKAKRAGAKVSVTSKVTVSSGDTKAAVVGGSVAVQQQVGRKWKTLKTATTDAAGAVKFKVKAKKGAVLRVQFAGMGEYTAVGAGVPIPAATSKAVRTR